MAKRCRIVIDSIDGPRECELELPEDATVADALHAAGRRISGLQPDWHRAAVGIFGRPCAPTHVPLDGDRIEVYRTLLVDPREARRNRAARSGGSKGRR